MSVDDTKFQQELENAVEYARQVCDQQGADSQACAVAWDTVEEMRAEVSHQHQTPAKTGFDQYLEDNPDAPEGLIYDT
ncbi:Calvin cycle protein CP12 [Halomicronema hongdechloris]|nr:Calvin cycle protein CP12 [Halomicronema hongdechloris]